MDMDANHRHLGPELEARDLEVKEEKPEIPVKEKRTLKVPMK